MRPSLFKHGEMRRQWRCRGAFACDPLSAMSAVKFVHPDGELLGMLPDVLIGRAMTAELVETAGIQHRTPLEGPAR
jgi:hypothetical protein